MLATEKWETKQCLHDYLFPNPV